MGIRQAVSSELLSLVLSLVCSLVCSLVLLLLLVTGTEGTAVAAGASLIGSPHDLSALGGAGVRAPGEANACSFCHISHKAGQTPLWSKPLAPRSYLPYESSTLVGTPGRPDGASMLCLNCHDGTTAIGERTENKRVLVLGTAADGTMALGPSRMGTDLRGSHPVAIFSARLSNRGLREPRRGAAGRQGKGTAVRCTSCHDPHGNGGDPIRGKFLRKPTAHSLLCLDCHDMAAWGEEESAHRISTASFTKLQGNHTPFQTVAEAGCEACHMMHDASQPEHLLTEAGDAVCLKCHASKSNGVGIGAVVSAAALPPLGGRGIGRPFSSGSTFSGNKVAVLPDRLVASGRNAGAQAHVACTACHNPHAASTRPSRGGRVSGALAGVSGVDRFGARKTQVDYEYELCFRCHSESATGESQYRSLSIDRIERQVDSRDLRLAFAEDAVSAHPVLRPGPPQRLDQRRIGRSVTGAGAMTCSSCHNAGDGTQAPHSSPHPFMLGAAYATEDLTAESPEAYALCYGCHDRDDVLNSERSGFPLHRKHVVDAMTSCAVCHSAHGVGARTGRVGANEHLINFALGSVKRNAKGSLEYRTVAPRAGECSLICHGVEHDAASYSAAGFKSLTKAAPRFWLRRLPNNRLDTRTLRRPVRRGR